MSRVWNYDDIGAECNADPGDIVVVLVEGVEYRTEIDKEGRQRFLENSVICFLSSHDVSGNKLDLFDTSNSMLDLNMMRHWYQQGKFTKRDYAELNMGLGYSVDGFCELSPFWDWTIQNPVWGHTYPVPIGEAG